MKPAATRVTIQRPSQKQTLDAGDLLPGGFSRISEVKIRKVYSQFPVSPCLTPAKSALVTFMGDTNPKNNQKKKAQQSAKKAGNQKKGPTPSPTAARKK
jgi:hypothetical protein